MADVVKTSLIVLCLLIGVESEIKQSQRIAKKKFFVQRSRRKLADLHCFSDYHRVLTKNISQKDHNFTLSRCPSSPLFGSLVYCLCWYKELPENSTSAITWYNSKGENIGLKQSRCSTLLVTRFSQPEEEQIFTCVLENKAKDGHIYSTKAKVYKIKSRPSKFYVRSKTLSESVAKCFMVPITCLLLCCILACTRSKRVWAIERLNVACKEYIEHMKDVAQWKKTIHKYSYLLSQVYVSDFSYKFWQNRNENKQKRRNLMHEMNYTRELEDGDTAVCDSNETAKLINQRNDQFQPDSPESKEHVRSNLSTVELQNNMDDFVRNSNGNVFDKEDLKSDEIRKLEDLKLVLHKGDFENYQDTGTKTIAVSCSYDNDSMEQNKSLYESGQGEGLLENTEKRQIVGEFFNDHTFSDNTEKPKILDPSSNDCSLLENMKKPKIVGNICKDHEFLENTEKLQSIDKNCDDGENTEHVSVHLKQGHENILDQLRQDEFKQKDMKKYLFKEEDKVLPYFEKTFITDSRGRKTKKKQTCAI